MAQIMVTGLAEVLADHEDKIAAAQAWCVRKNIGSIEELREKGDAAVDDSSARRDGARRLPPMPPRARRCHHRDGDPRHCACLSLVGRASSSLSSARRLGWAPRSPRCHGPGLRRTGRRRSSTPTGASWPATRRIQSRLGICISCLILTERLRIADGP